MVISDTEGQNCAQNKKNIKTFAEASFESPPKVIKHAFHEAIDTSMHKEDNVSRVFHGNNNVSAFSTTFSTVTSVFKKP